MNSVDRVDGVIMGHVSEATQRIRMACARANRDPASITLVAVTKTFSTDVIRKACALGLTHIGENRVQEIIDKFEDGSLLRDFPDICLHLIGHLQSNKVRKAVQFAATIDSVDSAELAHTINDHASALGKNPRVLIEVNTSGESQKFGDSSDRVLELVEGMLRLEHLDVAGLMTVGPNVDDEAVVRNSFRLLREAFENARAKLNPPHWKVLSMGMSGDYEIAIEEGATEIRLGAALFGPRRRL